MADIEVTAETTTGNSGRVSIGFRPMVEGDDGKQHQQDMVKHVERVEILSVEDVNTDRPYAVTRIIKAGMSLNRREYPADVLAAGAHLYSGVKMMLDHPDYFTGYSVRNLAGVYGQAEWDSAAQAVTAPLHFLVGTEAGKLAFDIAKEEASLRQQGVLTPEQQLVGISHVAFVQGDYVPVDDKTNTYGYEYFRATKIEEVLSGDMVVFPAAGGEFGQLFEGVFKRFAKQAGVTFTPSPREEVVAPESRPSKSKRVNVNLYVR